MAAWQINEQFRGSGLCRPVTVAVSRELFQDCHDVPVPVPVVAHLPATSWKARDLEKSRGPL